MSLTTPDKISSLQRKLYGKAKAEPAYRFYLLYDKIHRPDILEYAYALARQNDGAPGVDGVTFETIEAGGVEGWLAALREELVSKSYRPMPVRRVKIPKPGGGERPLGIPTVRDRVVQTAAKLVLEPIFEADLEDCAYGYRPERSALDAVQATHRLICRGYADVVDADLSKYFDTIPRRELMQSVARRICDPQVLRLIKLWLSVPVEERDGKGRRRRVGGKRHRRGTPQGGVISPMLANLYMNRFLKHWRTRGCGAAFRAHLVNYADDFVILGCGHAEEALTWTRGVMAKLGLSLNEAKTSVKNARAESFDFLGYTLGPTFARCRTEIPGRESFPEKRATHQGQDRRSPEARREGLVAERARQTEPPAGGLVGVLQLRNPRVGLSGRRSPCQRERSPLPRQTAQGARARRAPVFLERNPRKMRRDPTRSTPKPDAVGLP